MSAAQSLPALLLERIAKSPSHEAYRYPTGDEVAAEWKSMSYGELGERARAIGCGLRVLGLEPEQRGAILASTRIEWILADVGILSAGAATTTVYPSSTPEQCAFILSDSASRIVFVENAEQAEKLVAVRAEIPTVVKLILLEGDLPAGSAKDDWLLTLAELEAIGKSEDQRDPREFERRIASITPEMLATLIYTSGTTGQPKGVELTHDNWLYEAEAIEAIELLRPEDLQYLWLPLAHSFGKVLEVAQFRIGFTTAIDGRVDLMVQNLARIRPTFVAAVPRVFEKVRAKVIASAREAGGLKAKIFSWALRVGIAVSQRTRNGTRPGLLLRFQHGLADRLVFRKLRALFGGRLRFFVSGAAPLPREVSEFFHATGTLILEGYGLTESSAASFVNRPAQWKLGKVGLPVPGTEVKIATDGEILLRGRGIMRGYRGLPEANQTTLIDGWLQTGDIGELDADGFLTITDRKKDLIKTAGGKYIAPQALEGQLKLLCPLVAQAVVHGDGRAYCTALVALDGEALKKWADQQGLSGSYAAIAARPEVKELIEACVGQLNANLPSYSTIKKVAILPADLTVEGGDLTPSLKIKRRAVESKYRGLLDAMYPVES